MATKTFCDRCELEAKPGETVLGYGYRTDDGEFRATTEDDLCKGCESAYIDFMDGKAVEAVPDAK
jgi:hypothetical protein